MASTNALKPITIWGKGGPNPPKVRCVAKELGIPYDVKDINFADLKQPDYLKINPNGRMPAIQDPNTGLTLWESGAIVENLVESISGQGPYYGQAVWFTRHHPEQVQSAKDRYYNELRRVTSVLNGHLKTQKKGVDGPWLVGGKCSFADLAIFQWQNMIMTRMNTVVDLSEFTEVTAWIERLRKRPAVKEVLAEESVH